MVLNAEDLTIHAINPSYKQMLGSRNVLGLPISEVFGGEDVDELIKVLRKSVRENQAINTTPIHASVDGDHGQTSAPFIHTLVPITDASGSIVSRVFIYSEKAE